MMKTMLMTGLPWENDDSVFSFFWGKTGNITGYRCYPGGRKELLVVQLVHLWHNSMVKLCAVETCCPVERAANIIALVSTFHFLLFLDLFSQIDLNPQERLPSFFKTDHATNKWK